MGLIKSILLFFWLLISGMICSLAAVLFWKKPIVNRIFALVFAKGAFWIAGVKMHYKNRHIIRSDRSYVYIGNHQSGFDLATFGSMTPNNLVLVGKKELLYIPFFGFFFAGAGNLLINRKKGKQALEQMLTHIRYLHERKLSIAVFPEGTRNKKINPDHPKLLPFKKGGFQLAIRSQLPIVPMVCSPMSGIVEWESGKIHGGEITMHVLDPIPTVGMTEDDIGPLMNRVYDLMQKEFAILSKDWKTQIERKNK